MHDDTMMDGGQANSTLGPGQTKQPRSNGHDADDKLFDEFMRSRDRVPAPDHRDYDFDGAIPEAPDFDPEVRPKAKAEKSRVNGTRQGRPKPKPKAPKARSLEWFHHPFIPMGKLSLLAGQGGKGKGLIQIDRAARTTRGDLWPFSKERALEGRVLWVEAEDDFDDTLKPRMIAAEVDQSRVEVYEPRELPNWETIARYIGKGEFQFVVLSPLVESVQFLGGDMNSDVAVRVALQGLRDAVKGKSCALSGICHTSKDREMSVDAVQKILGASAFANLARSAEGVRVEPPPEGASADEPMLHRLALLKHNLSPEGHDLLYWIEHTDPSQPRSQRIRIRWEQPEDDADTGTFFQQPAARKPSAANWLLKFLTEHGPTLRADVIKAGDADGHKESALRKAYERGPEFASAREGFQGQATWSIAPMARM